MVASLRIGVVSNELEYVLNALEACMVLEKKLKLALLDLLFLGSASAVPHICEFLKNYFLKQDMKLKKMGFHLTTLHETGLGSISLEASL